jgi:hypothetical protein
MLQASVSSDSDVFRGTWQVFDLDVAKVDRDVAYVAMVVQYVASFCSQCFICFPDVCCKRVYLQVAYVLHIYCKCFLHVAYVFAMVSSVFPSVSDA